MVNRTALTALLLALAAPSWANTAALQDAQRMTGGNNLRSYDGGCTGGSCGAQESVRIQLASDGALKTGGLTVTEARPSRQSMIAMVPAPSLNADKKDAKDKPGFFSNLFSGKGLMYGLGGAAAGAGIGFLLGGPIGAIVGGLLGAVGGFFLSKLLAK